MATALIAFSPIPPIIIVSHRFSILVSSCWSITGSESKITRFRNAQFSRFILSSPLSKLVMRVIVRRNGGECKLPVHVQWFDKMKLDAIILMHYPLMSLQS